MQLYQAILAAQQITGTPVVGLPTAEFIRLLREEEDYYPNDVHNTRLMITRLRKIFYDQWGWNAELIEGATAIDTRYVTTIVDEPTLTSQPITRYKNNGSSAFLAIQHRLEGFKPSKRLIINDL